MSSERRPVAVLRRVVALRALPPRPDVHSPNVFLQNVFVVVLLQTLVALYQQGKLLVASCALSDSVGASFLSCSRSFFHCDLSVLVEWIFFLEYTEISFVPELHAMCVDLILLDVSEKQEIIRVIIPQALVMLASNISSVYHS